MEIDYTMKKTVLMALSGLIAVLSVFVCTIWWYDYVPSAASILLCAVTVVIDILCIWIIWDKIEKGKSKGLICAPIIVVFVFLLLIIFKDQIQNFLFNLFCPIGPGGLPPTV